MSDKLKDHINSLHDYGLSIPTKTITIFGEIDEDMKIQTINNLHLLDQVTGEVTIHISSEGGCVESGLAIYDAIRAMKNSVKIIAYGGVSSMATVIFQAADTGKRFMTPNSYLMLHHGKSGVIADPVNKRNWENLQKHQEDVCCKIYLTKIREKKKRFTRQKLDEELLMFDTIFKPKQAIDIGLADNIIEVY